MPHSGKTSIMSELLTYRRPAGSKSEKHMINRFIDTVPGMQCDSFGNRMLAIGSEPQTMISVHTDSVHTSGGRQAVDFDTKTRIYRLAAPVPSTTRPGFLSATMRGLHGGMKRVHEQKHRDCLGADDAAGIYAALRMIEARVPALYVFHRAEEVGGLGSMHIAHRTPELLSGIKRCIALDRRGQYDVVTHQMMGRCCSDDFAFALGYDLDMMHGECPFGSFTDSANYTDLIGECTNLSVGYEYEHTSREFLDFAYLEQLIDRLCTIDLDKLPSVRKAGEREDWRAERRAKNSEAVNKKAARGYLDSFLTDECGTSYGTYGSYLEGNQPASLTTEQAERHWLIDRWWKW